MEMIEFRAALNLESYFLINLLFSLWWEKKGLESVHYREVSLLGKLLNDLTTATLRRKISRLWKKKLDTFLFQSSL